MKRLLVIAAVALAAVIASPPASAHVGVISITCTGVQFNYFAFTGPSTTIHETITLDGTTIYDQNFTLVGEFAVHTVPISVPFGTHTIVATGTWTAEGGGIATQTTVLSGCAPPPPPSCTFTKGYWRNHPAATAAIVNGLSGGTLTVGGAALTAAQVQAILNATPGQPGSVTFTSNSLLNLTQQLIAALLNLNGNVASGPAAVQSAIATTQAGIAITNGRQITTTFSQSQIGSLTSMLSGFNEGQVAGIPHCG